MTDIIDSLKISHQAWCKENAPNSNPDDITSVMLDAAADIERLRAALRLFVDMPDKFEEGEFLTGIARMRQAFDTAKAVISTPAT